jgi:tetratricopeptide (TPR) repeat protein
MAEEKTALEWNAEGTRMLLIWERYGNAIKCFDNALKIDPQNAFAWNQKGISLSKMKRYREAIQCYDKAIAINPAIDDLQSQAGNAWYNKGNDLFSLKRYDEAVECYDKILAIDPSHRQIREHKENALKARDKL